MAEKAVNNYMKQSFQMNADVLELTVDNKIKYVTPPNEKHTFSKVMNTLASLPQKINPKKTLHLPHVEESQPQPSSAKPTNDQPTWKRGVPHHQLYLSHRN
jgi:hypothetical protein